MELDLRPGASKVTALCGLPPKSILDIASRAIQFWEYHKNNELQYEAMKTKNAERKAKGVEQQCQEKFVEMQNKINILNHKVEVAQKDLEVEKREFAELQEKYAEKVRQKRKIEELYQNSKEGGSSIPRSAPYSTTPTSGMVPSSPSKSPLPFRPTSVRPPEDPLRFSSPRPRFSENQSSRSGF